MFFFLTEITNAQWVQTGGIIDKSVYSMIISGSTIFMGTSDSGVYRSTDNGITWIQSGLANRKIWSFAVSGAYIFAATDNKIWRSGDGGLNWTSLGLNSSVYNLYTSGTSIYASLNGSAPSVYISTNNGSNWSSVYGMVQNARCVATSGSVYAGTMDGIYENTPPSYTWTNIGLNGMSINCMTNSGGTIYIGTNGLYKFSGVNFVSSGLSGRSVLSIYVSGSNVYAGASDGVWYSSNGGGNWTHTSLVQPTNAIIGSGSTIFAGTSNYGVYRSTDNGVTWTQMVFYNNIVKTLYSSGSTIFAGTSNRGVLYSSNSGTNWVQTSLKNNEIRSFASNGNYLLAGTGGSGIYRSTNNGTNWAITNLPAAYVNALQYSTSNNSYYAGAIYQPMDNAFTGGVWRSSDNGLNWTPTALNYQTVHAVISNGSNLYAGTDSNGIYRSTNNGTNWVQSALNNKSVRSFALLGSSIVAGTESSGIYISTDGTNWNQTSLNNTSVRTIVTTGNYIIAGTINDGIYLSSDGGSNWVQKNQGFQTSTPINALLISNNYLIAGAGNSSMCWSREFSEIIGINQISVEVPSGYFLEQNYPNPFNSVTSIKFKVKSMDSGLRRNDRVGGDNRWGSRNDRVVLKVFDLLGREVKTLVNEVLQPGTYSVRFDAGDLPSGIYFYQLRANNFSETKKLILLK